MRWAGKLGYSQQTEIKPGLWEDSITEVDALGELNQRTEALDSGDTVLPRYRTTTSVSVLSDGSQVPLSSVVYLTMRGDRFAVSSIVHQWPRIVYYVGEVYDGPLP